jgi:hypothetical protein
MLTKLRSWWNNFPTGLQIFIVITAVIGTYFRFINLFNLGFYFDMVETQYTWGRSALGMGLFNFWKNYPFDLVYDYPQLSLIYEYTLAWFAEYILGDTSRQTFVTMLKGVNWLVELWFIYFACFTIPRFVTKKPSHTGNYIIAGLLYSLPALWFVSGLWGQNDTLMAGVILLVIYWIYKAQEQVNPIWYRNLHLWSGIALSIGIWIKQQPLLILPVVFFYYIQGKSWKDIGLFVLNLVPYGLVLAFISQLFTEDPYQITYLGLSGRNWDWIAGVIMTLMAISLIHIGLFAYQNRQKGVDFMLWLWGFMSINFIVLLPFILVSVERSGRVTFALVGRTNVISNGAAGFWELIRNTNDAGAELINIFGFSLKYSTTGILIYLILMIVFVWKVLGLNWSKVRSLNLQTIYPKIFSFKLMTLFIWLHTSAYFLFFTKMHSRYLHIGLLFAFLYTLLIWGKKYYKQWLTLSIIWSLSYWFNQILVFAENNDNIPWVLKAASQFDGVQPFPFVAFVNVLVFVLMYRLCLITDNQTP